MHDGSSNSYVHPSHGDTRNVQSDRLPGDNLASVLRSRSHFSPMYSSPVSNTQSDLSSINAGIVNHRPSHRSKAGVLDHQVNGNFYTSYSSGPLTNGTHLHTEENDSGYASGSIASLSSEDSNLYSQCHQFKNGNKIERKQMYKHNVCDVSSRHQRSQYCKQNNSDISSCSGSEMNGDHTKNGSNRGNSAPEIVGDTVESQVTSWRNNLRAKLSEEKSQMPSGYKWYESHVSKTYSPKIEESNVSCTISKDEPDKNIQSHNSKVKRDGNTALNKSKVNGHSELCEDSSAPLRMMNDQKCIEISSEHLKRSEIEKIAEPDKAWVPPWRRGMPKANTNKEIIIEKNIRNVNGEEADSMLSRKIETIAFAKLETNFNVRTRDVNTVNSYTKRNSGMCFDTIKETDNVDAIEGSNSAKYRRRSRTNHQRQLIRQQELSHSNEKINSIGTNSNNQNADGVVQDNNCMSNINMPIENVPNEGQEYKSLKDTSDGDRDSLLKFYFVPRHRMRDTPSSSALIENAPQEAQPSYVTAGKTPPAEPVTILTGVTLTESSSDNPDDSASLTASALTESGRDGTAVSPVSPGNVTQSNCQATSAGGVASRPKVTVIRSVVTGKSPKCAEAIASKVEQIGKACLLGLHGFLLLLVTKTTTNCCHRCFELILVFL